MASKVPDILMWCPICERALQGGSGGDDKYLYKWGCCRFCYVEFVEHREERWEDGWRPEKDAIDRMFERMRS